MSNWGPFLISEPSFQKSWLEASSLILKNNYELRNLIVNIADINKFETDFHNKYTLFCNEHDFLSPKHVAYTIFPYRLKKEKTAIEFFKSYNRKNGFFSRRKTRWGTYFRRLTFYETGSGVTNQLGNIIDSINSQKKTFKSAYTMIIPKPGGKKIQLIGSPCLNYLALQLLPGEPTQIGLLAVYRNHDFLMKAYGNYWGLIKLLKFICDETSSSHGPLTCISSHAYIDTKRTPFRRFLESLDDN